MGQRGPAPKRSDARIRRNKGYDTMKVDLDRAIAGEVEIPAPPTKEAKDETTGEITTEPVWHPIAEDMYLSFTKSGQALFYEPSDWMVIYAACEALSREFSPKPVVTTAEDGSSEINWVISPVNGAVMAQVLKAFGSALATEADRRRLSMELQRRKAMDAAISGDGKVTSITQNRQDIFG